MKALKIQTAAAFFVALFGGLYAYVAPAEYLWELLPAVVGFVWMMACLFILWIKT